MTEQRDDSDRPTPQAAIQQAIGKAIRHRRRLVDMTQQELAACCGVSYQQIQKYEAGEASLYAARLWMIATALGVSAAEFFEPLSPAVSQARA